MARIAIRVRFYGVDYTSVNVNSNGTLNFDLVFASYFNQALPTFAGAAIFAFWDDLYLPTGGDVSSYFYAPENAFIIEWQGIQHFPGSDPRETFQVWLYNIATNPGPNGSSQIRIQYNTISPNTCTVGIQDQSETIANQYVFDGSLDPNAQGLANGRVITYGGCSALPTGTISGTITNCGGGPAPFAQVSFPGSFYSPISANGAGFYTLNVVAGTYNVGGYLAPCSYAQTNGHVVTEENTTTVNLTLAAPGTIQGTVTSCTGGPAVGATVTLSGGPVTPPPQNTNGVGFYSFGTLPAGNYDVSVAFGGCAPSFAGAVVVTSGNTTTQNFTLVTDPRAECSIDDPYGYHFCEDLDIGGIPFDWQPVSTLEGGPGTNLNIACDDCIAGPYPFPFAFQFYGVTYTDYYVGSNGYIMFGTGAVTLGGCMPADFLPAGVFAYWADLYTVPADAQVASYYDATNHWLVVEWYNVSHCCSQGNYETFEIVVYDEAFRPTELGDNDILIQYSDSLTHYFNSGTVGIKSAAGPNFSQYDCQGTLDPSAFGMAVGRSILFTTGPGCELGPPQIVVTPTAVAGQAAVGGTDSEILQICNTGPCPLRWRINFDQVTPAASTGIGSPFAIIEQDKDYFEMLDAIRNGIKAESEVPYRAGHDQLDAQGGPDAFGYRWIDSDEPGGPVYSWVEINGIGTNTGLSGDDQTMSFGLPFTFNYYGIDYNTVNISSNGNVHFGPANAQYTNQPLPCAFCPLGMIGAFWDDLYLPTGGAVYYYNDVVNNRFIAEWDDIPHISGIGTYNFEIILNANGTVLMQYETLTGDVSQCGVGTNNETGAIGLQIANNQPYLHSDMAISIRAIPDWLTVAPGSGELAPGNCVNLTLNFDAGDLAAGTYDGNLIITNNDPDENPTTVPVTFTVGQLDAPLNLTIYRTLVPNNLKFRWIPNGAPFYKLLSSTTYAGPYTTVEATVSTGNVDLPGTPANQRKFYVVVATDTP